MGFDRVHFKGTFRTYQQRVLDHADEYLRDGRIHVVAAPGSGKTVLGLELIRRLGQPCIVLSPTTAIRQQWGERFRDLFLDDKADFDTLYSGDLHRVRLLTSITYQALFTAVEKHASVDEDDVDCSDVDVFAAVKQFGIKTICLDEAHHLKNEWQKALEKFISALDSDVCIISLTATPPYDAEGSEWNRYRAMCGEIDEEIFVPELVGQSTLCPHQDYVYFNYPTEQEIASFAAHKTRAAQAVDALGALPFFEQLCARINASKDYEALFANTGEYVALLVLLRHWGQKIDKKLIAQLTAKRGLPLFSMKYAEVALQFLLDGALLDQAQKDEVLAILRHHAVYEKRRVTLALNEKLRRALISSVGKLESIRAIAKSEAASMGEALRMLVLTDYIKKETLGSIGEDKGFGSVNVVSIFDVLRRDLSDVPIGVLSGTLVILPRGIDLSGVKCKTESIPNTAYCTVEFAGETHKAVDFVGKLFEKGEIRVLVGTKSLLGEGWDSPCINTLILASFVGSFVLSNQMRGRAIRIDKNHPDKSANIWHLVTVEPEYLIKEKASERIKEYLAEDHSVLHSYDFEVLTRRFDAFMGPDYQNGTIESGIERLRAIKPPFDAQGIARINAEMLERAKRREQVRDAWQGEVADGSFAVAVETEVPREKRVPTVTFWNAALTALLSIVIMALTQVFVNCLQRVQTLPALAAALLIALLLVALFFPIKKLMLHVNPARSIKTLGVALYKTLRDCDLIAPSAKVHTNMDKELASVSLQLRNASIHDQNVFNTAMAELLSPIENPRYILISKGALGYRYVLSFACPAVLGKKKEYVEVLTGHLKKTVGKFEAVYTHREDGRKLILKCRKHSYVTFNQKLMNKKYKVSHWK